MPPEVRAVWQVVRYLRQLVEADRALADLWIGGEVSNLTLASSGHMYFTLKDSGSQLRCVFFRGSNLNQRDRVSEGAAIVVHGNASVYEGRGELQFVVDFVQPAGTGALQAEFERRKARFAEEGLFAAERKRPLPRFPRRVGVVTSARGAAFHDVQTVLARRWPMATIVFQPVSVQGEEAAVDIAEGIRAITPPDRPDLWPDLLIVGRGGGSAEDLWSFNEEPVVRAIFGAPVPVICAVGHETDTSLADLAADLRAPTPSAAAEMAVPDRAEVSRAIGELQHRAEVRLSRTVAASRESVDARRRAMEQRLPDLAVLRRRIAVQTSMIHDAVIEDVGAARSQTSALVRQLETLSPEATLGRGYALVTDAHGRPVPRAGGVRAADRVRISWQDGGRDARVESDA